MMEEFLDSYYDDDLLKRVDLIIENAKVGKKVFFDLDDFLEAIDFLLNNNQISEAVEAIKIALHFYSHSSDLKIKYARILNLLGAHNKALKILSDIKDSNIHLDHEYYLLKGELFLKQKKVDEAIKQFDKAIKLVDQEKRGDLVYEIAQIFLNEGKDNIAAKYLLLAYEFDNENLLILYDLGITFERLGYWEKSIKFYNKFLDIDPFSENIWYSLAYCYYAIEKFDKALEALEFALAINPGYISCYHLKGEIFYELENYEKAISIYNEVIKEVSKTDLVSFCSIGDCYIKLNDFDNAFNYYNKALEINPNFSDAWYGLAQIDKEKGLIDSCVEKIKKAIDLNSENADYWFSLGEIYKNLNKKDLALKAFSKAIEIEPSDYESWIEYARIYFEENKIYDAIDILNKAYQYNYNNSTINYELASYYIDINKYSEAMTYFERGLALNYAEHKNYLERISNKINKENIENIIIKFQKENNI